MDKKIQEIREALEAATQEDETMTWIHADGEKAIEYISYLLQQIDIKDKALEFYANKDHYDKRPYSTLLKDEGKHARAARGEDTNE